MNHKIDHRWDITGAAEAGSNFWKRAKRRVRARFGERGKRRRRRAFQNSYFYGIVRNRTAGPLAFASGPAYSSSAPEKKKPISKRAVSGPSEPWITLRSMFSA